MTDPVEKRIIVPCDRQTAFDTFVRRLTEWWPDAHTVSAMKDAKPKKVVLEPNVGGRLYEVTKDGTELDWGRVEAMEDGKHLALSWHINAPASKASRVAVTFEPAGDGQTEVVLVHSDFERLGDEAEATRNGYDKGWVNVFENHFAQACQRMAA